MTDAFVLRTGAPALATLALSVSLLVQGCRKGAPDEVVDVLPLSGSGGFQGPPVWNTGGRANGGNVPDAGTGGAAPAASGGSDGFGAGGTAQDGGVPPPPPPFTKARLLEAIGQCTLAGLRDFEGQARVLSEAARDFAATGGGASPDAVRAAWASAMAGWQRAELFRFGPAARSGMPASGGGNPGAQDLRDQIYAFPTANSCTVDRQIVDRAYQGAGFAGTDASGRGLGALEYLLFHTGPGNACSPYLVINTDGSWAALGTEELARRRADYAAAAASELLSRATTLLRAWEPTGGNFYGALVDAGAGSALFGREQDALNAVSDGLFYLEIEVKDLKLARPLGMTPECTNAPAPCPDKVESRYAFVSSDHIRQNLVGFRRIFQGCGPGGQGLGFDDWLEAMGAGELSASMLSALSNSEAAVDHLTMPLEVALGSDIAQVRALYDAIKGVTDLLKVDFVTTLDLEAPDAVQGDVD